MIALADLRADRMLVDDLARTCDFNLDRAARDHAWIRLAPPLPFAVVAGDSCGGVFLAYGTGALEARPILYATSEGRAGRIADSLDECIAMMLALPCWQDVLHFSGGGDLDAMRRAAADLAQDEDEDDDDLPPAEVRARLLARLPLPAIDDPVRLLHARVRTTDCALVAEDGCQTDTLFNRFTTG